MFPVLGYYNSTAAVTWTQDMVGSHSHLMLPAVMAAIVALTPAVYGYAKWEKTEKALPTVGFLMVVGLIGGIWVYLVSGVGNYSIPTLFQSPDGVNGIAMDDVITGTVALGSALVLIGLLLYARKAKSVNGTGLLRDPLFLSLIAAWLCIFLLIPMTGYYIEMNEWFYKGVGIGFDAAYARFHQDFAFFLLPALATTILIFERFGISGGARKNVGRLYLTGIVVTFVFGTIYTLASLDMVSISIAALGGLILGVGALLGAEFVRKSPHPSG
jgi:hypothetical protein